MKKRFLFAITLAICLLTGCQRKKYETTVVGDVEKSGSVIAESSVTVLENNSEETVMIPDLPVVETSLPDSDAVTGQVQQPTEQVSTERHSEETTAAGEIEETTSATEEAINDATEQTEVPMESLQNVPDGMGWG